MEEKLDIQIMASYQGRVVIVCDLAISKTPPSPCTPALLVSRGPSEQDLLQHDLKAAIPTGRERGGGGGRPKGSFEASSRWL